MSKVNIGEVNIFYRVFREEQEVGLDPTKDTLIVHHGGMGFLDHQIELEAWKPFSNYLQVVYLDQRGCGQSDDGDPEKWTMDQFGDDIKAFSEALGLKNPILGGVSSGGYASIACATRHPEFPRGLMLLNTEPVTLADAKRDAYLAQAKRADKHEFSKFANMTDAEIDTFAKKAGKLAFDYDMENVTFEAFAKYGFETISKKDYDLTAPVRVNQAMKDKFRNGFGQFDYQDDIAKVTCPVIWFSGEYDPIHPYTGAQEAAAKLPNNCEYHLLSAGAPVYCDAPDAFYKAANKFLEERFSRHSNQCNKS